MSHNGIECGEYHMLTLDSQYTQSSLETDTAYNMLWLSLEADKTISMITKHQVIQMLHVLHS
jgi:hypothetical protein